MKYISLLVFVVIIALSQILINSSNAVSYETHSSVQIELKNFIQAYIQEHVENLKDFRILNFNSEMIEDSKIKVNFNYSFKVSDATTGLSRSELDGVAMLTKVKDKENEWSLDSIQIEEQKLEFQDPIIITPEGVLQEQQEENKSE